MEQSLEKKTIGLISFTLEEAIIKVKAVEPRNETTAVERDKIITAIQHLVEEFGGADKALIAANRTPTPRRLKKTSKFVKRALRILIRADKGLEIHTKRGTII